MPRITNATNEEITHTGYFIRDSRHSDTIRPPERLISFSRAGRFGLYFFVFSYPMFTFALETPTNLTEFVNNFISILNIVIPFTAFFGFFGFLIGVLKYVGAGGDEEQLGKAKQLIVYGLIGLLIMFSFWGLAKLLANTYLSLGV